jgi:hypothetical protein
VPVAARFSYLGARCMLAACIDGWVRSGDDRASLVWQWRSSTRRGPLLRCLTADASPGRLDCRSPPLRVHLN